LSGGREHSCAILEDHTVQCWGRNDRGQGGSAVGTYSQVDAGSWHNCGVLTDGHATCWGGCDMLSCDAPLDTIYTHVEAGVMFGCGLTETGRVDCWGQYADDPPDMDGPILQVAGGAYHACALGEDGLITCWGSCQWGECDVPLGTYSAVVAGASHTCGIEREGLPNSAGQEVDGRVRCWGYDEGEEDFGIIDAPAGSFEAIVAGGGAHTCAVAPDDTVQCWGYNEYGQTDVPVID